MTRHAYGPDPAQFGDLYRPADAAHQGTVVIVHGGFWRARYHLDLGAPLARDLAAHGYSCWNLEYRRVGAGGGWPGTFEDVAAGIDHLATLGVDTASVVAVGHSAGGQLAVWAAGRPALPDGAPGSRPRVRLSGVVAQAGVLDLAGAARRGVGATAVTDLLGAGPDEVPERYRLTDPLQQVPLSVPVLCVHAPADENVPLWQSSSYVEAATRAGAAAELRVIDGDHFTVIDPDAPAWELIRGALPDLLAGRLPTASR